MLSPNWKKYSYEKDINLWNRLLDLIQGEYKFNGEDFFEDYKKEINRLYDSYVATKSGGSTNPNRQVRQKFRILSGGVMSDLLEAIAYDEDERSKKWHEQQDAEQDPYDVWKRNEELQKNLQGSNYIKKFIKISSRIDYPQKDLPELLWRKENGSYVLQPEIETYIKNLCGKILSEKFNSYSNWFDTSLLGSSISTQFWNDKTDIDVKIVIDQDKFRTDNPAYETLSDKELKDKLADILEEYKYIYKIENHDIEFYPEFIYEIHTKDFLKRFDSLYDIYRKGWIKLPEFVNYETYDRDEAISEGEQEALTWAQKWDMTFGDIKRKIKDFELVSEYIKTLDKNDKLRFRGRVVKLLNKIKLDIDRLYEEKKIIKQEYYDAYDEFDDNLEKYYHSVNAMPEVIRIKLLNLWGYIKIIRNLSNISEESHALDKTDVVKIKNVFKSSKKISLRDILS